MGDTAILVENIGKMYRIGATPEKYRTLRDRINTAARLPGRYLSRLARRQPAPPRTHETVWALKDVSFEVKQGDIIGIIGKNGSGKSTLLKILSRITEPTTGYAAVHGRVGTLLEVGIGFHPELTGRENIYLNGAILGMKRGEIDRKFDEIVDFSGIERFIDTPVKRYSSGMYLRLAFSVAAHLEPEILLVDEVLAVGDAAFQRKCLGKMSEVSQQGRTVLFVSHNMGAITNLTTTCLHLQNGQLLEIGDTETIVNSYLAQVSEEVSSSGWADLTQHTSDRPGHHTHAEFISLRTLNAAEMTTSIFREREPMTIEVGIQVLQPTANLQFGLFVEQAFAENVLFTVPSQLDEMPREPGVYTTRLTIDPNHLRGGTYSIGLKLFARGLRQDTVRNGLSFEVQKYSEDEADRPYLNKWVNGPLRFDYDWTGMKPVRDPAELPSA